MPETIDPALLAHVTGGTASSQKRMQTALTELRTLNGKMNPQQQGGDAPQPSPLMQMMPRPQTGTSLQQVPSAFGTIGAQRGG